MNHLDQCPKCGGTMFGDGYNDVIQCENATNPEIDFMAPDEGPVYCEFEEE
jgi:Zn-finger nucleic acid-binding protein